MVQLNPKDSNFFSQMPTSIMYIKTLFYMYSYPLKPLKHLCEYMHANVISIFYNESSAGFELPCLKTLIYFKAVYWAQNITSICLYPPFHFMVIAVYFCILYATHQYGSLRHKAYQWNRLSYKGQIFYLPSLYINEKNSQRYFSKLMSYNICSIVIILLKLSIPSVRICQDYSKLRKLSLLKFNILAYNRLKLCFLNISVQLT